MTQKNIHIIHDSHQRAVPPQISGGVEDDSTPVTFGGGITMV
jgi:hypothetical protein